MISIAMFNNKGGVGKTTLLCNLAGYLQKERSKKVLVIDADPQCNTTTYALSEDIFDDLYLEMIDEKNVHSFTIKELVEPLKQGDGFVSEEEFTTVISQGFQFDLLPGNPGFATLEDFLSKDWGDIAIGEQRGIKTTMFVFHVLSLCKNYDYVFFDMGPALGAINRAILLACDYFITPMSSDIFSLLALDNIGTSISAWKGSFNEGIEKLDDRTKNALRTKTKSDRIKCTVRFLGYVTQQYITKESNGSKRAVRAYDTILRRFPESILNKIVLPINYNNSNISSDITIDDYKIGSIPNFYSLIPMSQSAHKPLFALESSDGVVGAHYRKVDEFRKLMGDIADKFIANEVKLNERREEE